MSRTNIEWTDNSWNPIRARNVNTGKVGWHCQKVSPGCENCYAAAMNRRLGTGEPYTPRALVGGDHLFLDEKMLTEPLRWRKPRKVFVCSMTDLFADFVPDEWLSRVWETMRKAGGHTFQILTKRSKRMRAWVRSGDEILPNVWLGVSAEDQQRLDERVPELLATPAAVRFVSAEPLLAPLDVSGYLWPTCLHWAADYATADDAIAAGAFAEKKPQALVAAGRKFLKWVIVGGESGPGARPMDVDWARDIIEQCRVAGVACFVKQLGAKPSDSAAQHLPVDVMLVKHPKGGDPEEWPEDLRVREMPAEAR